jgi:hypothetical protein
LNRKIGNLVEIGEALPQIFKRSYPVIQPTTELVLALSLLRFHQIDALPVGFKADQKKRLAVFGYSCLSRLLETEPKNYGNFLKLPAKKAALELSIIDVDEDIRSLLQVFQKTKFGFAWVESKRLGGFASLRDMLRLYDQEIVQTQLSLSELASPIFSLPEETEIRNVLKEMFARRIRRIFIEGTDSLVTDRQIIGHLFSASRLEQISQKPKTMLEIELGDLETFAPKRVNGSISAKTGAKEMLGQMEECLVCEKGVITPWDIIMKPLARGELKIKD